jgi:hypothetical protein
VSGGGILGSTALTTTPEAVTYTPAAGFTGTAVLKLTSNDPDGGGNCLAVTETREIIVLPPGNIQGCIAPVNWTLANANADGSRDASQAPCSMALIGGNNLSGNPGTSDLKTCSGTGTFSFNWGFTAPTGGGQTPLWYKADTKIASGTSGSLLVVAPPSNLKIGNLIIVTIHTRRNPGTITAHPGFTLIRKETNTSAGTNTTVGAVSSYYKIATTADLGGNYTFNLGSNNSSWRITASRVTGHNPTNPIGNNNGIISNNTTNLTVNGINTTQNNSLLIAALTVTTNVNVYHPTGMIDIHESATTSGDNLTSAISSQSITPAGATGNKTYTNLGNNPAAAQLFVINPAPLLSGDDAAYVIVNGVETLITNTDGTNGVFSIAVSANDQIGFRVKTNTNTGGVGKLTIYNPIIPNNVPVVTGQTAITIPVCNPATPINYFVTPTATDNCVAPTLVATYPHTSAIVVTGCSNTQTRTWKYVDSCGLESLPFVQTITWTVDTTAPTFTGLYSNVAIGCNPTAAAITTALGSATATDGCSSPIITYTDGAVIISGCNRSQNRTFTATDGCGNNATAVTRSVTWTVDTTFPVITATGTTTTLGCNPSAAAINAALGTATGSDGCAPPTVAFSDGVVSVIGCSATQTRNFTATDTCNNIATTTRTVTWKVDSTAPTASNPATINIVGCNLAVPVPNSNVVLDEADNCGTPVVAFLSDATAIAGCLETTTRTYSVTDACNNTINVTQIITRTFDITVPAITCPASQIFCQDAGNYYTIPAMVASDNCSGALTVIYNITGATIRNGSGNDASGIFNLGISTIAWTLTDACGNTSNCSVTVTINAVPSAPVVGTITQPDCITSTGSVVLSGLPAGNWKINPGGITGNTASVNIPGLAANIYNFTVTVATCTSALSANVVIQAATTATWNGTVWINGPPTKTQALEFTGTYNSMGDLEACSCTVYAGVNVKFKPLHTLTISNSVTVLGTGSGAGTLTFESDLLRNSASLVQINNVANINYGDIYYQRSIKARKTDYTYWSSPVSPQTLGNLYSSGGTFYSYEATTTGEDWSFFDAGWYMVAGKGYIANQGAVIPLPGSPSIPVDVTFKGVPNNGPYAISGVLPDKSYLLGNPYPSAIDANKFLDANAGVLDGTLYFWTHNTALDLAANILNPGPGWAYTYSLNDYASYNRTGGAGTAAAVGTGANLSIPSGKIAAGQGFFGSSKPSITGTNEIVFNNDMRVDGTSGNNSRFFKTKNPIEKTANTIERHRVWLDLMNKEGAFKQTLIGYVTDATNDYDDRFDGESYDANEYVDFYSVNQDRNLVIQGRALPFDENDQVLLGYRTTINGEFTINIDQVDGLLTKQAVFIEDKLTNTIFDLKKGNYTFTTVPGTFNDRFVLRYVDKKDKVDESDNADGIVVLYSNNFKTLIIRNNVKDTTVNSVTLFNILGQKIAYWDVKGREQTIIQIPIKNLPSNIYIVKVKTTNGENSKKIIIK